MDHQGSPLSQHFYKSACGHILNSFHPSLPLRTVCTLNLSRHICHQTQSSNSLTTLRSLQFPEDACLPLILSLCQPLFQESTSSSLGKFLFIFQSPEESSFPPESLLWLPNLNRKAPMYFHHHLYLPILVLAYYVEIASFLVCLLPSDLEHPEKGYHVLFTTGSPGPLTTPENTDMFSKYLGNTIKSQAFTS